MNAFPPLPPFFPSQHRLPGHSAPQPAQERRRRTEAVILPLEVHLARRFFHIRPPEAPPPAAPPPVCPAADDEPTRGLVARVLGRVLRVLVGG